MALPEDTNTPGSPLESVTDELAADSADLVASPPEQGPAGIVVAAAAVDGPKADLTLLELQDLLNLRIDEDGPTDISDGPSGDSTTGFGVGILDSLAQLRMTADLPADLTDLDLDQVLNLQLSGDTLPTVLEVARLPADLTSLELAQLLGLELTGDSVPTVQEVIQLAVQTFNGRDNDNDSSDRNNADTDTATEDDSETDNAEADNDAENQDGTENDSQVSESNVSSDSDEPAIAEQSLTEHAALNSAAAAKAASEGKANGKPFSGDGEFPGQGKGLKDKFGTNTSDSESDDSGPPPASTTESSSEPAGPAAPITNNASASGAEDAASIAVTLTGSDADGTVTSFSLSSLPSNGTLYTDVGLTTAAATGTDYAATGESLTLYFVPDANYNGVITFDFAAKDDSGDTDSTPATATVTVTAVNDAPVATNDTAGTLVNTAVIVSVLGNDSDIDLDTFTITGVTQGANGSVVDNGDGTVTYTPNAAWTGADSFTYTIDDGNGGTDTATVNVTVSSGTINGTAGNDTLTGTAGDDTINGLGGNDLLDGRGGADALDGGTGTDTATYSTSATAVNVNLATGTGTGGDAQGDTLANIENLTGSTHDDTLTGDANANVIDGGDGADTIDGGAGADTLTGGGGDDSVMGGDGADDLNGLGGNDTLEGGAGNDTLSGGGGSDWLDGGAGADELLGSGGADTLVWDFNDLTIDGAGNTYTLRIESGDADITTFAGTIDGIDQVDMEADAAANTLTVSYADVLAMTDNADTLTIIGDAGDSLDAGTGWTDGGIDGNGNQIYTQGNGVNEATLVVDPDVSVNANILL